MANWKQVQGRIRKAKASSDAAGELTRLYESTRDAMVAFELARVLEKSQQLTDAVVWYRTAAERFRRTEWRQKAIDAISNLGGTPPTLEELEAQAQSRTRAEAGAESGGEVALSDQQGALPMEEVAPPAAETAPAAPESEATSGGDARKKRTRRGRRGGRGRRKRGGEGRQAPAAQPAAAPPRAPFVPAERHEPEPEPEYERAFTPRTAPAPPPPAGPPAGPSTGPIEQLRGRSGDPGLASRSALLESQLRRLFAAAQYSPAQAEEAPAGPGVFLISDSDQVTHYYVEACRTLRIAIGHVLKAERGKRSGGSLKGRLADHLGVSEPKALKYMKDHCTVRWLQLDTDSQYLAHFAIAILRPVLNMEED